MVAPVPQRSALAGLIVILITACASDGETPAWALREPRLSTAVVATVDSIADVTGSEEAALPLETRQAEAVASIETTSTFDSNAGVGVELTGVNRCLMRQVSSRMLSVQLMSDEQPRVMVSYRLPRVTASEGELEAALRANRLEPVLSWPDHPQTPSLLSALLVESDLRCALRSVNSP